MLKRSLYLIDPSAACVASLDVAPVGDHFEGTLSLAPSAADLERLFEEYEEIVEGQVFSLLDEVEQKVTAARLRFAFEGGCATEVYDLQVFPSTRAVSFKIRQPQPA